MAWIDIEPDETLHYAGEEAFMATQLNALHVGAISEIYLREARAAVLRDLGYAFGINPQDPEALAAIDELVDTTRIDNRADILQQAIAYKQMELLYTRFPGPEGSQNDRKRSIYARLYAAAVQGFPGLATTKGRGVVTSIPIRL